MTKAKTQFGTVLRVKKHQEKVAQQQLMQIQDAHIREQDALARLHEAREDAVNEAPKIVKARATDLQVQRAFIFKLSRQIDRQTGVVEEIREKESEKRGEVTQRAQSRQMVEKLDERKQAETVRELDRKEQSMIDELANRKTKVS